MGIGCIKYGHILLNNTESILRVYNNDYIFPDSLKSDVLAMIERFSFVDGETEYVIIEV